MTQKPGEGTSKMEVAEAVEIGQGLKRKATDFINVDVDTGELLTSTKRRTLELDEDTKVNSLRALIIGYNLLYHRMIPDEDRPSAKFLNNISISNQITSIILTLHNICRQRLNTPGITPKAEEKARKRSFKIEACKKECPIPFDEAMALWLRALKECGLQYQKFEQDAKNNWIGTLSPYLSYHAGFQLRVKELRMGHSRMISGKTAEGNLKGTPVSSLGLNGAHHVLLEGITYNPERRSAMVQSLGPMTTFIQMLKTTDPKYRKKWEEAVKAQMGSISCIDDIITTSKTIKRLTDFSSIMTLIAEILLISTSRQIKRMFMPLIFLHHVYLNLDSDDKKTDFLKGFNVSGHGGYNLYSKACEIEWHIAGDMSDDKAAQMVFHGIFGTFCEDLGILEQITNVQRWYTREEFGGAFKQQAKTGVTTPFKLPRFSYYSKLASANQNTALAGIYEQVTYCPTFAGFRNHKFSDDFFEHLKQKTTHVVSGKTISQLETALSEILSELRHRAEDHSLEGTWGTVKWYNMDTVSTNNSATEAGSVDFKPEARNKYFMAKSRR